MAKQKFGKSDKPKKSTASKPSERKPAPAPETKPEPVKAPAPVLETKPEPVPAVAETVDPVILEIDKFEDDNTGNYSYKLKIADPANRTATHVAEFKSKTKLDLDDQATRQEIWKNHGPK